MSLVFLGKLGLGRSSGPRGPSRRSHPSESHAACCTALALGDAPGTCVEIGPALPGWIRAGHEGTPSGWWPEALRVWRGRGRSASGSRSSSESGPGPAQQSRGRASSAPPPAARVRSYALCGSGAGLNLRGPPDNYRFFASSQSQLSQCPALVRFAQPCWTLRLSLAPLPHPKVNSFGFSLPPGRVLI